jgi:hypothetical protein
MRADKVEGLKNTTEPTKDWQQRYQSSKEQWADLRRASNILIPILLLIFLATISAIAYVILHAYDWTENLNSQIDEDLFFFRLYASYLMPLLVSAISVTLLNQGVINFVKAFYNHPKEKKVSSFIKKRLLGSIPLPPPLDVSSKYPIVTLKEPYLDNESWIRWLGGPAILTIYDSVALYLECGNRFSRVVGPGNSFLDRYETVKAVVDLRPQVKTGIMRPWTKDGIQVEMEIRMECQINASEMAIAESQNLVYPFDPIAVKEAVEYTAVKRDPKTGQLFESDWLDGTWGQATGYLARHVSCHSVDEIALAELKDVGSSGGNLHAFPLAKEHIEKINQDLAAEKINYDLIARKCGAHVTSIHLIIKFPKEIEEKRIAYWLSERKKLMIISESKAEADSIRTQQEARANELRDILDVTMEGLRRLGREKPTEAQFGRGEQRPDTGGFSETQPEYPAQYIFMSYSRRDETIQKRIVTYLRKQGINIWVDNEKLVPGTPIWMKEIEKSIKGACAVIVLLSPDSNISTWVLREIGFAEQHKKRIFPVFIRGNEETAIPINLITHQRVDLRQQYEDVGLSQLAEALKKILRDRLINITGDQHSANLLDKDDFEAVY